MEMLSKELINEHGKEWSKLELAKHVGDILNWLVASAQKDNRQITEMCFRYADSYLTGKESLKGYIYLKPL